MGLNPAQSLRGFAASQPPLLVFTICLMAFGLTMVVLAYLIGESELPNPDVTMDWNKFLGKITELEICIPPKYVKNSSSSHELQSSERVANIPVMTMLSNSNTSSNFTSYHRIVDQTKSMSAVLSQVVHQVTDDTFEDADNITVSVKVPLWISGDVQQIFSSVTQLSGVIQGQQLGLSGKLSAERLNVTVTFPPLLNVSCEKPCHVKNVCLTLHMSSVLLPHTKMPEKCQNVELLTHEIAFVDFIQIEKVGTGSSWCHGGGRLHLDYTPNPKLTEMLSIHERSIVNLHLMHTSYFLFVMVMTLLCYALIKGRYRSPKPLPPEKIPLDA